MDYKYLYEELDRFEEIWKKGDLCEAKAVGKAQRWHWKGLNEGFEFALKGIRDTIDRCERLRGLIDKLTVFEEKRTQKEIERKAKIEVLEEILLQFKDKTVSLESWEGTIKDIQRFFAKPFEDKLKELIEEQ